MKHLIPFLNASPLVAVVRLQGVIASGRQGALSDKALGPLIERAFRRGKPKAVALVINSPGGSPVQSSLIAARIKRLSEEKGVPVYAFVEDVAASGGYWLACAAESIYADPSSIVGSIGVISAGFGLDDFISRHGIARRVYTSGESKSQLDPFQPENPEDIARLKVLQSDIHDAFKDHVKQARAGRLSADEDLFTGAFWTGTRGLDLGLVDEIGHLVPVMKKQFGDKVRFAAYGPKRSFFRRIGVHMLQGAMSSVEERGLWARFGL